MATQTKNKAAPSISIDSQATGWQGLTDSININGTNDVASQVIYSSIIDTFHNTADVENEESIADIENNAEAIPAELATTKIHYSLALNNDQTSDILIDDGSSNSGIIGDIENNEPDAPVENLDSDSDQTLIITNDETAVVNEEADVNVSESVWFMHSESWSTMVWVEPTTYIFNVEDESKPIDIEASVIVTSTDDSLSDDINYSEQPIVDYATPVDEGVLAGESTGLSLGLSAYTKPFIIYDDSYFEKAIDEGYVADELTDPVIDTDFISIDLVETGFEIIEETTDDQFYEFIDEPIIDYVAPIDEIVPEEPFIIDDTLYEEYIVEEYNPADPVIDTDLISEDQAEADFEIIEEINDDFIDDSTEELVEDYETPNDEIIIEDDYIFDESIDPLIEWTEVDPDSYLIDEPIDNTTDPLAETTEVTDEPVFIYSYVSCWTTNFTLTFDYQTISESCIDLTALEPSIELKGGDIEIVESSDLTITPLGLPVTADWICITPF